MITNRMWSQALIGLLALGLFGSAVGCTIDVRRRTSDGGGIPGRDAGPPTCDTSVDSDMDGIPDGVDGTQDTDGDGTPNYLDTDSDNDGVPDSAERGSDPCSRPDVDGDGLANHVDPDSDNDGLSDGEEVNTYGTDPNDIDSDDDGVTDLGEVRGSMTDPNDASSTIPSDDFFVVLRYNDNREMRPLRFGTDLQRADVYFLIDTTGSMGGPIANVRSSLSSIAAELASTIPDVGMGVGRFDDFPFSDGGFGGYGSPGDVAYEHMQDITTNVASVQTALNALGTNNGNDWPESHTEALYQTATAEGGNWNHSSGTHSIPAHPCPAVPDEPRARVGYPCFRNGALPIVVTVSDATWHNGPGGSNSYTGISPAAHTFDQAATALSNIGARTIGVIVGTDGRTESEALARATGTVDGSGTPLVYTASDGTVSSTIVDGIRQLAGETPQIISATAENVPGNPDGVDATTFIKAIVPVAAYPAGGISGMDATAFYDVVPGTEVEFRVEFFNDVRTPRATAEIFRARIVVLGNRVSRVDEREVYIIVPPDGSDILI